MKKLMTIVLAIVLIAGFTSTSNAQISIGAKAGIALPMGTFGDVYGLGFGGSAIGEYALNENMAVGLNIGYYTFSGKDLPAGYSSTFSVIPIIVDYKYFFQTEGFMPYVGAGLGMYLETAKTTTPSITVGSITIPGMDVSASESKFGFAPKVGFWMGDGFKYGASLEYNLLSDFNHLGINVGFIYPLGK
ncbi:MAG: outer membrane beta-barrel protein [Bacteroidales bacterium]